MKNVRTRQVMSGRQTGIVLKNSGIFEIVLEVLQDRRVDSTRILDVGAGQHLYYTQKLRQTGWQVGAIDLPENMGPDHTPEAWGEKWDVIFAGRVFNVLADDGEIERLTDKIKNSLTTDGVVVLNLPESPRNFGGWPESTGEGNKKFQNLLKKHFETVIKTQKKNTYIVKNPRKRLKNT